MDGLPGLLADNATCVGHKSSAHHDGTTSGANGGFNLVLAANASNSVSGTFVIPDNWMFIKQAIADASTDGGSQISNKGTVFIPEGLWYMSTIPFPSSGIAGVKIVQTGAIELFLDFRWKEIWPAERRVKFRLPEQADFIRRAIGRSRAARLLVIKRLAHCLWLMGPGAGIDLTQIARVPGRLELFRIRRAM